LHIPEFTEDVRKYAVEIERGDNPRVVAESVWKALSARSPQLRYPVGKGAALSRLRRFVPASMFDRSLRKQLYLD